MISVFNKSRSNGIKWISNDKYVFWVDSNDGNILILLWEILTNIIIENDAEARDIIKIKIGVELFQKIILLIIIISLNVLIVGGAEILIAININHHKVMLGMIINIFLKSIILREWNFIYKSLVRKNNAEDAIPCAIIIIRAPINPI